MTKKGKNCVRGQEKGLQKSQKMVLYKESYEKFIRVMKTLLQLPKRVTGNFDDNLKRRGCENTVSKIRECIGRRVTRAEQYHKEGLLRIGTGSCHVFLLWTLPMIYQGLRPRSIANKLSVLL